MKLQDFFQKAMAVNEQNFSIVNGMLAGEQILPEGINMSVSKENGNFLFLFAEKPSVSTSVFEIGGKEDYLFTAMILSSEYAIFTLENGKKAIIFYSNGVGWLDIVEEVVVIDEKTVFAQKGKMFSLRTPNLAGTINYPSVGRDVTLYGETLAVFMVYYSNYCRKVFYNRKKRVEILQLNPDKVEKVEANNPYYLEITMKGDNGENSTFALTADGVKHEKM